MGLNVNPGIDGATGNPGNPGSAGRLNGGIGIGIDNPSLGIFIPGIFGAIDNTGRAGRLNGGNGIGIAKLSDGGEGILHFDAIYAMKTFSESSW